MFIITNILSKYMILLNLVMELLRSDTTSTIILKTPPPPLLKKENIPLESGKLANVLAKAANEPK
ncbi:MAG: hypothetical protein II659_02635 [Bacteroidales bacterium]|nr:hypothetical protein [Bacteroidales bacterium]